MNTLLILTILIVVFALAFDFINGFHDTANSIATAVSTKALKPKHAIIMAACMNFIGAMTFTGVAKTITKGIVDPFQLTNGSLVILAALISAIIWNLVTWYFGIPSSSSHAIIGSIAGAAIASSGFSSLNYTGFIKIIEALILSPIIAFIVGFTIYSIFKFFFRDLNLTKTKFFRGSFSVEAIFTLFGFKLLLPNHFYMSRGNHESDVMNKMYGFEGEVKSKYNIKMAELFTEIFNYLPLTAITLTGSGTT